MLRDLNVSQRETIQFMLGVYVSRKGGKYGLLAAIQYYIKCRYEVNVEPRAIRQALKEAEELRKTF